MSFLDAGQSTGGLYSVAAWPFACDLAASTNWVVQSCAGLQAIASSLGLVELAAWISELRERVQCSSPLDLNAVVELK